MADILTDPRVYEAVGRYFADPAGFVRDMWPWGEGALADEHGPDTWQLEELNEIGERIRSGEPVMLAVSSGHGVGKAHAYGMALDTPDGPRRWGDLEAGDRVFAADGTSARILQTHHYTDMPMYRVTFSDGTSCEVSSGHLWTVRGRQCRRNDVDGWRTLETQEIARIGARRSNGVVSARQWEIPAHLPVEYPKAHQTVAPYILGAWLGDGTKRCGAITSNDEEMWEYAAAAGYDIGANRHMGGGTARTHVLYGLQVQLKNMGVFGCTTKTASVPRNYKYASIAQRTELLQGLLDTDGWVEANGTIAFGSISKDLNADVVWLARSLGMVAREKVAKTKWYRGRDGQRIDGQPFYTCTITWDGVTRLFRLDRKQSKLKVVEARYTKRWIDDIQPIQNQDGMCITIDRKDGLYLANDFIVTHNSAMAAWIVIWFMATRPQPQVVVTANTAAQLSTKTWRELAKWHRMCRLKDWFEWTATKFAHRKFSDTWFASAIPWSLQNSEAFAGTHEKHVLLMFDEASGIPDQIWEVAEGAMTTTGAMWIVFGNPTRSSGRLYEACFGKLRHRWKHKTIDSRTAKQADKAKIQEWIDDYGEDSDFVRVRVRGLPPKAGSSQFISSDIVLAAVERTRPLMLSDPIVVGVDVARFGDDSNVVTIRQGFKLRTQIAWRETDLMQTAARVASIIKHTGNVSATFVDEVGLGAGVLDRLRQLGHMAIGVHSGTAADEPKLYYNRKAEMWDRMREWLKRADIPDSKDLISGLTATEYGFDSKSRIQIEKKSDLKSRGLPSPDEADSLALTFAYAINDNSNAHAAMMVPEHSGDY